MACRQTNEGDFLKQIRLGFTIKQMPAVPALALTSVLSANLAQAQGRDSDESKKAHSFVKCRTFGFQQAPALPGAQPISSRDRVFTADQTSNTISVIAPSTNTLFGTLPLGNARPDELLGALYNKQIDTHGLGFSKDGSLLAVINVTTDAGVKYNLFAVKTDGTRRLIGDFRADAMDKGSINPLLKFFDAGFVRVEVPRAG